jgi:hypothetical protein
MRTAVLLRTEQGDEGTFGTFTLDDRDGSFIPENYPGATTYAASLVSLPVPTKLTG